MERPKPVEIKRSEATHPVDFAEDVLMELKTLLQYTSELEKYADYLEKELKK
jgi:hypothetical protein